MTGPLAGGTGSDQGAPAGGTGNSGTDAPPSGAPTGTPPAGGTGTGATDTGSTGQPPTTPPAPAGQDWEAIARAARDEAAKLRVQGKKDRDELVANIGRALGLVKDDVTDPAKLQEQLASRQAREAELENENLVLRTAMSHGANPQKLADSRTFMTALGKLDATAADHAAQVAKLITDHVAANPEAKLGTPAQPGPTPPPVNDTSGGNGSPTPPGVPSEADGVDGMRSFLFRRRQ